MSRYVAGYGPALAAFGAGALLWTGRNEALAGVLPPQPAAVAGEDASVLPDRVQQASERTREEMLSCL